MDETVVKANRKHYYVYAAIGVEWNELILMRVAATISGICSVSCLCFTTIDRGGFCVVWTHSNEKSKWYNGIWM